ncbi:sensor histidine kinase [Tundrisphaera lichenicola]|uniref:sensor histidine kinase n=1 Tax=Tundrisphaera lichenicola TaxID=2029860 RepID=UPI003EB76435
MQVNISCRHCGRPLNAPREFLGRTVQCGHCRGEFLLDDPGPAPVIHRPTREVDSTLSRSMLMKIPNLRPGPSDAMVCRLEPGSLRVVQGSDAFVGFVGSTPPGRSRSLLEYLHPDDRALAEDEFRQAVEVGERHDFVLRVRSLSGDWHYMRIFTQARYDPDGSLDHVRCFLKDVTDRVHAEQELRRRTEQLTDANERLRKINRKLQETQGQLVHSEKLAALGTLSAGMAHEINNPLAFATNNVAVLARDLSMVLTILGRYREAHATLEQADPETASAIRRLVDDADLPYLRENLPRLVESTRRGLGRVAQIVADLRAFANLDRAPIGEIDVNESIDQGLCLIGGQLARERIELIRDYAELPRLQCAPAHLNQVFLNLLINAMQAVEATGRTSGTIRVITRADQEGSVVVEIVDNGVGIPPEVIPKIFDPFFTTRPIGKGSGLGLSLGHGIISDHGGTIEVESVVGAGSTFRVRLPSCRPSR